MNYCPKCKCDACKATRKRKRKRDRAEAKASGEQRARERKRHRQEQLDRSYLGLINAIALANPLVVDILMRHAKRRGFKFLKRETLPRPLDVHVPTFGVYKTLDGEPFMQRLLIAGALRPYHSVSQGLGMLEEDYQPEAERREQRRAWAGAYVKAMPIKVLRKVFSKVDTFPVVESWHRSPLVPPISCSKCGARPQYTFALNYGDPQLCIGCYTLIHGHADPQIDPLTEPKVAR